MKSKIIGSERAAIEVTIHSNDFYSIDFYTKHSSQWQRINVPTIVLIGKQLEELKEFINEKSD